MIKKLNNKNLYLNLKIYDIIKELLLKDKNFEIRELSLDILM
jgi:hypothetical protein